MAVGLAPVSRTTGSSLPGLSRRVLGVLVIVVAVLLFLFPLWWMLINSLRPGSSILNDPLGANPRSFSLDNWRAMLANVPIIHALGNTAIVVGLKGAITLVFCPLAGYGFAKFDFPFKKQLFGFVLVTLMLPTLVLIIPLLVQMGELGWINTYKALVLPGAIDAFSVFWMRQVISEVPDELIDAAKIDGAGVLRTFYSVVVPVIRPGLAALAVLSLFNIYNDLVWPIVAINDEHRQTLAVLLASLATNVTGAQTSASSADLWGQLLAASTFATIPTVVIFLVLQRHFIRGLLAGSAR